MTALALNAVSDSRGLPLLTEPSCFTAPSRGSWTPGANCPSEQLLEPTPESVMSKRYLYLGHAQQGCVFYHRRAPCRYSRYHGQRDLTHPRPCSSQVWRLSFEFGDHSRWVHRTFGSMNDMEKCLAKPNTGSVLGLFPNFLDPQFLGLTATLYSLPF